MVNSLWGLKKTRSTELYDLEIVFNQGSVFFLNWIISPHGKPVDNESGDLPEELPMEEKTDSGWKHPAPVGRWFIPISSHYLDLWGIS